MQLLHAGITAGTSWVRTVTADLSRGTARTLVILIGAACFASTLAWLALSDRPPAYDGTEYFLESVDFYQVLRGEKAAGAVLFQTPNRHGCLFQLLSAIGMLITGPVPKWGAVGNLFCIPLLTAAVYGVGRALHSRRGGVLAVLYVVTAPIMVWLSHTPLEDFALTTFTALALFFLIRSDSFKKAPYSIAFGIAAGLGTLAKLSFLLFILLPLLFSAVYVTYRVMSGKDRAESQRHSRAQLRNLIASGLLFLGIAALWYAPHIGGTLDLIRQNRKDGFLRNPRGHFVDVLDVTVYDQLGALHALVAMAALIWGLRRVRKDSLLWLSVIGGGAFWCYWPNKDPRYTLPIVVALGAWTGGMIASIRKPALRTAVAGLFAATTVFLYAGAKFTIPGMPDEKIVSAGGLNWTVYVQRRAWTIGPPHREGWPLEAIVEAVKAHRPTEAERVRPWLLMTRDGAAFGPSVLEMHARLQGYRLFAGILFEVRPDLSNVQDILDRVDFVLLCPECPAHYLPALDDAIQMRIAGDPTRYTLIARFHSPDSGRAALYSVRR